MTTEGEIIMGAEKRIKLIKCDIPISLCESCKATIINIIEDVVTNSIKLGEEKARKEFIKDYEEVIDWLGAEPSDKSNEILWKHTQKLDKLKGGELK